MKHKKEKLKLVKYSDYHNWLKRIYLLTIRELYEQKDYSTIKRVIWNYRTFVAIIKSKDTLYRDQPSVRVEAKREFLGVKGGFVLERQPRKIKDTNVQRIIHKPLLEKDLQEQNAINKRAAVWFETITPIPEDNESWFDGSTWQCSI